MQGTLLPNFKRRKHGQIGVVASVAGYMGMPLSGPYGASKAALINLCESLKFDFDPLGIKLSVINPGFIRTPMTDQNKLRMPFLAEPEDMARAIWLGLKRGDFEITYPKQLAYPLKALRSLPYRLFFPLVRKGAGAQLLLSAPQTRTALLRGDQGTPCAGCG